MPPFRKTKRKQLTPIRLPCMSINGKSQKQTRVEQRRAQGHCVSCTKNLSNNSQSCHYCQKFVCNHCLTVWLEGLEILPRTIGERFCRKCNDHIEKLVQSATDLKIKIESS